ncbi:hypothetical protein KQH62_01055 [bacterium]|nr:hypothetical protein [bacterium]
MFHKSKLLRVLRLSWRILRVSVVFIVMLVLLAGSAVPSGGLESRVRTLTRPIEFDFGTWTLDALAAKLADWGFSLQRFLSVDAQTGLVYDYLAKVGEVQSLNNELLYIYADPAVTDPDAASVDLRQTLTAAEADLADIAPVAEAILQSQLMDVASEAGLKALGQTLPPSLFIATELPMALIVSPRDEIFQSQNISLNPGMTAEEMDTLETQIYTGLDQSALVVPLGGIGTYPTMVDQTTNLNWLLEVIAHEWTHNYLTLHPLGINYNTTAALRTINETTASIAGKELSLLVLEKYYPEAVPKPARVPKIVDALPEESEEEAPAFDYRAEMRLTRQTVDDLLASGDIEGAESYMESRRQMFWENGYLIRKLNQAYFAFYGAYNDTPGGGASGEDPVGPAVQAFRSQFDTLAAFLRTIARVSSFAELQQMVE